MRGQQMRFQLTAVGLACVTLLSACGGGSDKNSTGLAQSIAFPFLGGHKVAPPALDRVVVLMRATASSGLAVTYKSNTPDVCSVDGLNLTLLSAGECSVTAIQAGGNGYAAAEQRQLFIIPKNTQSLVFFNPGRQAVGASVALQPATTDALGAADLYPIVYTTSTPNVCSVTGTTLNSLANGACIVTATQAGNGYYLPISKNITVAVGNFELPPLNFVTGYKPGATRTAEDGVVERYAEHPTTTTVADDGSTFTFSMTKTSNVPNFGGYYGFKIFAPGLTGMTQGGNTTQGVQIEGQGAMKFSLVMNPEIITAGKTKLRVWLYMGHHHMWVPSWDPDSAPQNCNVVLEKFITPTFSGASIVQEQSIDLHDFIVSNSCDAGSLTPWTELQSYPIGKIEINVPDINNTVPNAGTSNYTTSVTMGTINFK